MKIAIIDDELEEVCRMAELLTGLGFTVQVFIVGLLDTPRSVAVRVREFDPDMVWADYSLHGEFRGYEVLEALGGKFWSPANPRVISISSAPHGAMADRSGAHFPHKRELRENGRFRDAFVALFQAQRRLLMA